MSLTTQVDLHADEVSFESAYARVKLGPNQPARATLDSHVETILRQCEPAAVQTAVRGIFENLICLLECLRLMEKNLHQREESLALFEVIRLDAQELVKSTETQVMKIDGLSEGLFEALDGMTFAVGHEVRMIFEGDLLTLVSEETPAVSRAKVEAAHRLLSNCLQQSFITMVQAFDPSLNGHQLFDNSRARLKESLILCRELSSLIKVAQRAEEKQSDEEIASLMAQVNRFRRGTMSYLMYRDWAEFESFADRLRQWQGEADEFAPMVHQFLCYLETLLGQVKMRDVLADLLSDCFPGATDGTDFETPWAPEGLRIAFELYLASD